MSAALGQLRSRSAFVSVPFHFSAGQKWAPSGQICWSGPGGQGGESGASGLTDSPPAHRGTLAHFCTLLHTLLLSLVGRQYSLDARGPLLHVSHFRWVHSIRFGGAFWAFRQLVLACRGLLRACSEPEAEGAAGERPPETGRRVGAGGELDEWAPTSLASLPQAPQTSRSGHLASLLDTHEQTCEQETQWAANMTRKLSLSPARQAH